MEEICMTVLLDSTMYQETKPVLFRQCSGSLPPSLLGRLHLYLLVRQSISGGARSFPVKVYLWHCAAQSVRNADSACESPNLAQNNL